MSSSYTTYTIRFIFIDYTINFIFMYYTNDFDNYILSSSYTILIFI